MKYDVRARDVPRDLFPSGRVRFSLGVGGRRALKRRRAIFHDLRSTGDWDIIHAASERLIAPEEIERLIRSYGDARGRQEIRSKVAAAQGGSIPTFGDEAAEYMEWYRERRRPSSVKATGFRLALLKRTVGDTPMDQLTREAADAAVQEADSAAYKHSVVAAGSGLLTWSIRREAERARVAARRPRWETNIFKGLDLPEKHGRRDTLTESQIRDMLAAAQIYQAAYLRGFVQCGFRSGELIHTRSHTDLDLETWRWAIQPRGPDPRCRCPQCRGKGWRPKTKNGTRAFIVGERRAELREAIEIYLEAHPCEPGDFLFRNPRTGKVWGARALEQDFKRLCEKAGVRYGRDVPGGVTLHSCRHTAITQLVRAGVRESVIADLVGDTIDEVMTYIHLDEHDLADGLGRGPSYAN